MVAEGRSQGARKALKGIVNTVLHKTMSSNIGNTATRDPRLFDIYYIAMRTGNEHSVNSGPSFPGDAHV
jgi:hypothetical protein